MLRALLVAYLIVSVLVWLFNILVAIQERTGELFVVSCGLLAAGIALICCLLAA